MFKRILLGYDGSDGARLALEKAAELARLTGAEVHVVAVGRVPEYAQTRSEVDEAREQAEKFYGRHLEEAATFLRSRELSAHPHLGFGKPSEEILRLAQEVEADLIVLGTHPHHPLRRRLLGATADKVINHAACPVLVVK